MKLTFKAKVLLIMSSLAVLTGCGSSNKAESNAGNSSSNIPEPAASVIVIGAGMSGMKAASELAKAGLTVKVLEGRDRIGGRTWSDRSWGSALDLGASWIHGIQGNPVHSLAQSLNVPLYEWDYDNQVTYDARGNIDNQIDAKVERANDAMVNTAYVLSTFNSDATIQDALDRARQSGDLDDLTEPEINYMVHSNIEQEAAADADKVTIAGLFDNEAFDGPDVLFPQGYDALVSALGQDLDIQLNTYVNAINYQEEQLVVTTNQGEFSADYVVVTVPLGVLKKDVITFTPELPQEKQAAIQALDMGVMNKVYLRFSEVFWDNSVENIGQVSEPKGHWSYWLNLANVSQQPVLLAFNVGSYGTEIEAYSDDEIVDLAMTELRKFYGQDIPQPLDHIITRWSRDPFSFGSYSYVPQGATNDMREDLAAPVAGKLFFAGEATHSEYPSTVHGAYLSGERAAMSIIEQSR
ncbi:flavin monoamine oxidase family protein [Thalassomonas actiniarum]|uniref:Tryptophan 2-monooxygenase n=1 Tax=Thalassomonas actiniarum TaxID=485447 RepID=A0AAE9YKG9_9GAMM|nr:FAD-dependent oxidoreductase [Thalassomonas actiniarum]WDD97250.1 FAD-dependent oxidoreductase [Thalassomonas actiniarum]